MSQGYFSYIRVSTARQGQTGTSLTEQREAIRRYADRWNLDVIKEYEERETAAKRGRPVFSDMMKALRSGQGRGVIIHKIDRSARNLKDWADLGELIDQGSEIHFANESLDLHSRGGRLSADIQAVVASDYIRNLREETRKGFYGRIKQGLYPRPAPVGYTDCGKGKVKEPDAVQAPLVRRAFEMYATGRWNLDDLVEQLYELGLRNKRGGRVTRNGLSHMLHNPFYCGTIRIKTRGEVFTGAHQSIITPSLFERVQRTFGGKNHEKKHRHFMLFRRVLRCARCQATLIGERQKGNTYYRCQTKTCSQKTIREDAVEDAFMEVLKLLRFNDAENQQLRAQVKDAYRSATEVRDAQTKAFNLQREQLQTRLSKLADAYIDGVLDKETYLGKKNAIVMEEQTVKEKLNDLETDEQHVLKRVEGFLELVNNAYLSYKLATSEEKREMVKIVTSNSEVEGKTLIPKLHYPFQAVLEREKIACGSAQRASPRILSSLLSQLYSYFEKNEIELRQVL